MTKLQRQPLTSTTKPQHKMLAEGKPIVQKLKKAKNKITKKRK
jgi:hypothetical protein